PYTGVLAIFLSRLLEGKAPVVYEDGRQTRDFVSVHDVVRAVDAVIGHRGAAGRVFNVGTGVGRPIGLIAQTVAGLVGRPDLASSPSCQFRTGDIRHCLADTRCIRETLRFEPRVDWEAGLVELLDWSQTAPAANRFAEAERELHAFGLIRGASG